jgi:hypothetical protein
MYNNIALLRTDSSIKRKGLEWDCGAATNEILEIKLASVVCSWLDELSVERRRQRCNGR